MQSHSVKLKQQQKTLQLKREEHGNVKPWTLARPNWKKKIRPNAMRICQMCCEWIKIVLLWYWLTHTHAHAQVTAKINLIFFSKKTLNEMQKKESHADEVIFLVSRWWDFYCWMRFCGLTMFRCSNKFFKDKWEEEYSQTEKKAAKENWNTAQKTKDRGKKTIQTWKKTAHKTMSRQFYGNGSTHLKRTF